VAEAGNLLSAWRQDGGCARRPKYGVPLSAGGGGRWRRRRERRRTSFGVERITARAVASGAPDATRGGDVIK